VTPEVPESAVRLEATGGYGGTFIHFRNTDHRLATAVNAGRAPPLLLLRTAPASGVFA
jgi:hypothetical protein